MQAINEKFQTALEEFTKNPAWASLYDRAPAVAKEMLEAQFHSTLSESEDEETHKIYEDIKSRMTSEDWKFMASFTTGREKAYYLAQIKQ